MTDWIYLGLLLIIAGVIIFNAVKKKGLLFSLLFIPFMLLVTLGYWQWGGWVSWQHYQNQQSKMQQVQKALKQFKTPDALIQKFKTQLKANPGSARGWYLLGRLYSSQNNWLAAHEAFQEAAELKPADEQYLINIIYSLWQINQQKFNPEIRQKLHTILQKNSKQPDALAMLAMDAYQRKEYQQAVTYWQVLLTLTPPNSEAAKSLRQAIAKAQEKLN